ncbi:MAG TPA: hypothetical protein VKB87_06575 [Myxococcaceae bacterium]|nr:hypothetical protein [Myxococcaceae bacterium]
MTVQPINLAEVISACLAGLVIIIPVLGLTIRFALKPIVEAIASVRDARRGRFELDHLAERVAALELQLQANGPAAQLSGASVVPELPARSDSTRM